MDRTVWHDRLTGTRYTCGLPWQRAVSTFLGQQLGARLTGAPTLQQQADRAAQFWRHEYYRLLFPLRLQQATDAEGWLRGRARLAAVAECDLDALAQGMTLDGALADGSLPPILPDPDRGAQGWLLADRALLEAALLNVLLIQEPQVSPDQRHAARLAALTYLLGETFTSTTPLPPAVASIATVLAGGTADVPEPLARVLQAVRLRELAEHRVDFVLVAVQRIKRYVFETPGLNEIRGGSSLLDEITDNLRSDVEEALGPEVVLRAVGSTLMFLAPATDGASPWPEHCVRTFNRRTGNAFPLAAAITVPAQNLLDHYGDVAFSATRALEAERARAAQSLHTTLPFESRCALCRTRPAEGWDLEPGEPERKRLVCRVCKTKRMAGQSSRRGHIIDTLEHLGLTRDLAALGVAATSPGAAIPPDLESLLPGQTRRDLIGVVYGDGNNFGAVSYQIHDIALGIQWAARVEHTTRTAVAIALAVATQQAARLRGWQPGRDPVLDCLPFQVLAAGGDDLSLFAWGPVAMHFAAEFAYLIDLEFKATSTDRLLSTSALTFSLGVLVADSKAPVAKTVEFADGELLGWAKQAVSAGDLAHSTIAMLFAQTAEAVPASLDHYRRETYLLESGSRFALCTTLRPYSAQTLRQLLAIAERIVEQGWSGRLQRLTQSLYRSRQAVLAGLLHYAYQRERGRERGKSSAWIQDLEAELNETAATQSRAPLIRYGGSDTPAEPFRLADWRDGKEEVEVWYSPLWDLVELTKIMS